MSSLACLRLDLISWAENIQVGLTCIKVRKSRALKNHQTTSADGPLPESIGGKLQLFIIQPRSEEDMNFRPLHDRIMLRRIEEEEKTAGGVIIPDTAKEKPTQGEVMAVGPGARNARGEMIPLDIAVGDRVLIGKWSGTEVKLDGEELLILKESDIMGIIEGA